MVSDLLIWQKIPQDIRRRYPAFGVNKQRELIRLLCEIYKRNNSDFHSLMEGMPSAPVRYAHVKKYLLEARFPNLKPRIRQKFWVANKLCFEDGARVDRTKSQEFYPRHIIVEEAIANSALSKRVERLFSQAPFEIIKNIREYRQERKYSLAEYNRRTEVLFLTKEKGPLNVPCPCTKAAVSCGYSVLNLGYGCPYDCMYCFLQSYRNSLGITLPANMDDFFRNYVPDKQRIGSGEFADSLALDHISEFSPRLVSFFRRYPQCVFEFKTKSANVANLLQEKGADNVVVAWSLNPPQVIESMEDRTAALSERLSAAYRCLKAGYKVAFHFDPIIAYDGWENDYEKVVQELFRVIDSQRIAWISLGTLRMTPRLKQCMESRFPDNTLLSAELIPGFDGKFRYDVCVRRKIYERMLYYIRQHSSCVKVYLCMEEPQLFSGTLAGIHL